MQVWIMALLTAYGPICDSFWWVKEKCDYLSVCVQRRWVGVSLNSCPANECDSIASLIFFVFV